MVYGAEVINVYTINYNDNCNHLDPQAYVIAEKNLQVNRASPLLNRCPEKDILPNCPVKSNSNLQNNKKIGKN